MRTLVPLAVALAWCAARLVGQYSGEPPAILQTPTEKIALSAAALGVDKVWSVHLAPHATLPAGVYYAGITFSRGTSPQDVMSGLFDSNRSTFTANSDVNGFNVASSAEQLLSFSSDLRVAVFERTFIAIYYATRSGTTGAFGAPAPVRGLPATAGDPALGQLDGKLTLFYFDPAGALVSYLMAADLDAATGMASNLRRAVTMPVGGASYGHAAIPMNDAAGETRAVVFGLRVSFSRSDAWFCPALDDSVLPRQLLAGQVWLCHGDSNGGTLTMGRDPIQSGTPVEFGIAAMSAATVPSTGGNAAVTCFAPTRSQSLRPYSAIPLFGKLAQGGKQFPGIQGLLGLDLATLVVLPPQEVDRVTGSVSWKFQLPPATPGTVVHGQLVISDPAWERIYLGNTSQILWR
jgi:hypothetical protein